VAVNPVRDKVYVANNGSNNLTVIDGATGASTTIAAGTEPWAVAVNPVTNKVYIANSGSHDATVIDGATGATRTVAAGTNPWAVAVNPVTNKVYVANSGSHDVTAITEQRAWPVPLVATIGPLPGDTSAVADPTFTFDIAGPAFAPIAPPVQQVCYQVDTWTGEWQAATPAGTSWTATLPAQQNGVHILFTYAADGQEATSINTGFGSSPIFSGKISPYVFLVRAPSPNYADAAGGCDGNTPCYTSLQEAIAHALAGATITAYGGAYAESVALDKEVTVTCLGDMTLNNLSLSAGTWTAPPGSLSLTGDFSHTGGSFEHNNGTLAFTGANTQTLSATVPTQLYDLSIGAGTTLVQDDAIVAVGGSLSNDGTLHKTVGLTGVTLGLGALGGLEAIQVERVDQDHAQATPPLQTGVYWSLTATGSGFAPATLSLPHAGLADPYVCNHLGDGTWDGGRHAFDATTVSRSGITSFSDWAVSDGPPTTGLKYRFYLPLIFRSTLLAPANRMGSHS
jgi:YVTN family beta-propeller protein